MAARFNETSQQRADRLLAADRLRREGVSLLPDLPTETPAHYRKAARLLAIGSALGPVMIGVLVWLAFKVVH